MSNNLRLGAAILLAMTPLMACRAHRPTTVVSTCDPAYRPLSQEPIVVDTRFGTRVRTSWILIGCRADLDALSDPEMVAARTTLAAITEEQGHGLMSVPENVSLRKAFAKRINTALGRDAVTDLYLADAQLGHPDL